jgi:hypothetical protein
MFRHNRNISAEYDKKRRRALRDEAREEEPDDGYSRSSSRSTNRIGLRGGEEC